ncbi:MAG: protease complex subunit PrcB family protein [Bacteroidota bacterium]|nr:protease complex subunit PrcB family protein [Bacteroidota bacterium]
MKRITLVVAGSLLLLSCGNPTKEKPVSSDTVVSKEPNKMVVVQDTPKTEVVSENKSKQMQPITWKEVSSGKDCSIEKPMTVVVTSQQEMDALWSKAFKGDWKPEKRSVDFSKSSIVAVFLGTVNTGGHSVMITSITGNQADGYKTAAQHKLPGKSCMSSMAIEYPYYIAVTEPTINGKTNFTITKKAVDCE